MGRFVLGVTWSLVGAVLVVACGARTGLVAPNESPDVSVDVPHEIGSDVDAQDALDVTAEDVTEEPIIFPDVPFVSCVEAGITFVYVITVQNELYSFYPPTLAFTKIGNIACPSTSTPFSMAVDRVGIAYSVFSDGNLFQISTANAACKATSFVPGQHQYSTFGMGYAGAADAGETLYVSQTARTEPQLGWIDTKTFVLTPIGLYHPSSGGRCELTGTGDGRLFAFCLGVINVPGAILQLDPQTATVLSDTTVGIGTSTDAFAYAFWGGLFWLFTGPVTGPTTVTRYDPVQKTATPVATLASAIVGAGVSTCAPE